MATQNGTALVISIDTVQISCQTDTASLSLTRDPIETTCKDNSGSAKTYLPGEYGGTIDFTANYDPDASEGYAEAFSDLVNGTQFDWRFGSTAAGGTYWTGKGYTNDLTLEAPQNERATWTGTITIDGEVTQATNPT